MENKPHNNGKFRESEIGIHVDFEKVVGCQLPSDSVEKIMKYISSEDSEKYSFLHDSLIEKSFDSERKE